MDRWTIVDRVFCIDGVEVFRLTMKYILIAVALGTAYYCGTQSNRPTLTYSPYGWVLSGVAMPPCPDNYRRTVDIPERDEIDSLAVSCHR